MGIWVDECMSEVGAGFTSAQRQFWVLS